ncbi:MAG: LacI family DNA-binding transcriptional regulator [Anaerobutyricum soehngenii]
MSHGNTERYCKKAGVSSATVSRILNQDETLSVTTKTRERVLEIAQELNYKKKTAPSSKTVIGIFQWVTLFQELEDPYYQAIRSGIERYCMTENLEIRRAFQSDPDYINALHDVQGLICIGKFNAEQIQLFESITPNVIFVDMQTSKINCNTISLDFEQAVIDALDYLSDLGHTSIAYLGGKEYLNDDTVYFEQRKDTFIRYCKEHHITYEPYLKETEFSADAGYQMMMELIDAGTLPSAVFAASDLSYWAMRYQKGYAHSGGYFVVDDNVARSFLIRRDSRYISGWWSFMEWLQRSSLQRNTGFLQLCR